MLKSMRCSMVAVWMLAATLAGGSSVVSAEGDGVMFNVYSLTAQSQGAVENDALSIDMAVQAQAVSAQELAEKINADMSWALDQMKRFQGVEVRTQNYRTWPTYNKNTRDIIGWEASQGLHLYSDNIDVIQESVQVLQARLHVVSMQAQPKPETRKQREDELIREALKQFRERATLIQQTVGAGNYRVIEVSVDTNNFGPAYTAQYEPKVRAMAESAPAIETGSSELSINVRGSIQLQ